MILVGILIILIGISVLIFLEDKENFSCVPTCGFLSGCFSSIGVIILCLDCFKEPLTLDVYRGNTKSNIYK